MTVTVPGGRQRPRCWRRELNAARPDAAALPGLGRVGDGRRLHRRARLRRALDPLRQDRGPRAVAARRDAGRRADRDGRRAAPRRRARADPAVRRLGGHARRDHAGHARSSCRCRRERRFATVAFPTSAPASTRSGARCRSGHRPSVVRMYDEEATRLAFAPVVGEELSGVYTVLAFEGEREAARRSRSAATLELAREAGAELLDPALGAALVGPALRLLPPAPPAGAALDLGHARRGRDLRAHRGGLRRAAHGGARALRATRASSCGCTSRTGTRGAR